MVTAGFVGMGPGHALHPSLGYMRDVVIHQLVQCHDPPDRPFREVRPSQQAPDAEPAGIRMRLLQVIDLHHEREPALASWSFRGPALVHQPGKVLGLEPPDPRIDRGPGHVQEATDADLIPALIIELDDLEPGLIAIRLGMIVPQPQVPLTRGGALLPKLLDRLVVKSVSHLDQQDPGQFPIVEPVIEGFEPIDLLPHGLRDGAGPPPGHHLDISGEES
jgi:hypothetical protein